MTSAQPGATAAFGVQRFAAELAARGVRLGVPTHWAKHTESTNDDALAAARAGAPHGAIFGAESQSRGRGRRGSEWTSAAGAGLWFSLVVRANLRAETAPGLALAAGLAVRHAVATRVVAKVLVKWPNDVLARDRKLAGVLVESQVSGAELTYAIVGIGLNVSQPDFPEGLQRSATSLALLGSGDLNREALLADVLEALEARLICLETRGLGGITDELRAYDALLGRQLTVDGRAGTGAGIDDAGRLLLRLEGGQAEPCVSGHVELQPEPSCWRQK